MEPIGTISEGEWNFLSGMCTSEEADFMAQLLGNCPLVSQTQSSSNMGVSPAFCWQTDKPARDMMKETSEGSFYISDNNDDVNLYHCSQGSSSSYGGGSGNIYQTSNDQDRYYIVNDSHPILVSRQNSMSMDFCMEDMTNTKSYLVEGDASSIHENRNGNVEETNGDQPGQDRAGFDSQEAVVENYWQPIPELETPAQEIIMEDKSNNNDANSSKTPRKRLRNTGDHAQSNRRNGRASKIQKLASTSNNDEGNNAGLRRAASSSCYSEDDSSGSPKLNGAATSSLNSGGTQALNLNGKIRASRGAATDPQSLYAMKRRERINERLRILQNLVPSGTKVDISTMLEEALHYVKFLQLQIKLLSSDDLWMYAPIAYNGMDIGLDLKVPTPR